MDLFKAVNTRFSYRRKMKDQEIPLEDLKKIVSAGLAAPSGKNEQTTGFVIIHSKEKVEKIRAMTGANGSMATAPAYIACHISSQPEKIYEGMDFEVEDCAAAVQTILLALTALGYVSVWIDGWLRLEKRAQDIGQMAGLSDKRVVRILLPVGIPEEDQKRPIKKSFEERVTIL